MPGRLSRSEVAVMFTEIANTVQVAGEHFAIRPGQPVVPHDVPESRNYVIDLTPVVHAAIQFPLQIIELIEGPHQAVLIAAAGEGLPLHVNEILTNAVEQPTLPLASPEKFVTVAVIGVAIAIIAVVSTIAIAAFSYGRRRVVAAVLRDRRATTAPDQVERISFHTILGIVNTYDRGSAVAWIAQELLLASAVDSLETKLSRIGRHGRGALESSPLGRLPHQVFERGGIPANLHLRRAVDNHFKRAFALIRVAAAGNRCSPLQRLSRRGSRQHSDAQHPYP